MFDLTAGNVSALGVAAARPADADPSADVHTSIVAWSPSSQVLASVWAAGVAGATGIIRQPVSDIYIGAPNESMRYLLTVQALSFSADWSPDGRLIALLAEPSVLVVDAASGSVVADLSPPFPSERGWSADGRLLAIESQYQGVNTIILWDRTDGSTQTINGFYAAWAPHSNRLAFVAGSRAPGSSEQTVELRVRHTDSGSEGVIGSVERASVYPWLTWSPGGEFVAMFVWDAAGGSVQLFDATESRRHVIVRHAWLGSWIDDSSLVVTGNLCSTVDLLVANADGSLTNVTNSAGSDDMDPLAAPDGRSVAFASSEYGGYTYVRLLQLPDRAIRDLVTKTTPYSLKPGLWSPDGRFLVYSVLGGRDGPCLQGGTPDTAVEVVH